jgi:hypothetical protein
VRGLVVLSVHPRQAEVAPGAAKAFGFSIPAGVLSIVDQVIESMTDVRFWAQRRPNCRPGQRPLLREERTSIIRLMRSAFDPTRTLVLAGQRPTMLL